MLWSITWALSFLQNGPQVSSNVQDDLETFALAFQGFSQCLAHKGIQYMSVLNLFSLCFSGPLDNLPKF